MTYLTAGQAIRELSRLLDNGEMRAAHLALIPGAPNGKDTWTGEVESNDLGMDYVVTITARRASGGKTSGTQH